MNQNHFYKKKYSKYKNKYLELKQKNNQVGGKEPRTYYFLNIKKIEIELTNFFQTNNKTEDLNKKFKTFLITNRQNAPNTLIMEYEKNKFVRITSTGTTVEGTVPFQATDTKVTDILRHFKSFNLTACFIVDGNAFDKMCTIKNEEEDDVAICERLP